MNFSSGATLLSLCREHESSISEIMLRREVDELGAQREHAIQRMEKAYFIMKRAVEQSLTNKMTSMGGLIGGEAEKIIQNDKEHAPVCGTVMSKAIAYAMGVLEVSASMGLIVAAPTAGSSGVIPGVFLAVQEEFGVDDSKMIKSLFNAGAVGYLIMRNATVAGAEGGCQAEVGAASAMAASAITECMGGTPDACLSAASMAISNLLGLVCDPVGGLVEAPCQSRNAIGASNALTCAQISLSGVKNLIPFDEMVTAMYRVGRRLPMELRETALGGCAATPTGCSLCNAACK